MKLEQQVCSLEMSKKLKELGVKQESLFYWVKSKLFTKDKWKILFNQEEFENKISAFTVAELGEM